MRSKATRRAVYMCRYNQDSTRQIWIGTIAELKRLLNLWDMRRYRDCVLIGRISDANEVDECATACLKLPNQQCQCPMPFQHSTHLSSLYDL